MKSKRIRVLYAEDVVFFRRHVSKVLLDAGFEITLAEDGKKALDLLDASQEAQFNLILSDIEMPQMTGLELAREVRKRSRFNNVPMIALTTRFKDKDIIEGKQAGFNDYLEKLNPEKLLNSIESILGTRTGYKEGTQS
jgi:two-component system chemotaxis sensor kinase CheA